jgi:hypothetical protein
LRVFILFITAKQLLCQTSQYNRHAYTQQNMKREMIFYPRGVTRITAFGRPVIANRQTANYYDNRDTMIIRG